MKDNKELGAMDSLDQSEETPTVYRDVVIPFDGNLIKFIEARKNKGLSQKELADALGYVDRSTINQFELGSKGLDNRGYSLFCLITGIHPNYVLLQDKEIGSLLISAPDGESIREMRINANRMTQAKMAKLLGLSSKTLVSNYENNRKTPSIQNWTLFLLITSQHPHYSIKPCAVSA